LLNFDTLELVPARQAVFPGLGGSIPDVLANPRVTTRRVLLAAGNRRGKPEPNGGAGRRAASAARARRAPLPDDVADTLWEHAASRLSSFFGTSTVRRGSQSLFVPSDVRIEEGAVQSPVRAIKLVFVLRDGTAHYRSVGKRRVGRRRPHRDRRQRRPGRRRRGDRVLALSRNGIVFPLELPTVTVAKGATETRLSDVRAAGRRRQPDPASQRQPPALQSAVVRNLDPAMIAGLLCLSASR